MGGRRTAGALLPGRQLVSLAPPIPKRFRGQLSRIARLTTRFNPKMYRMIFDIVRFNLFAIDLLAHEGRADLAKMSIGEYLDGEGYGQAFKEDYLLVSFVTPVQSRHSNRVPWQVDLGTNSRTANDGRHLVHTGRQGRPRLSGHDARPLLSQPPPAADHGQAEVDDCQRRIVRPLEANASSKCPEHS